ncbi:MAG: PadR family transcriptional regulator [Erysipelotrichaceae bacterium]|nr:PadR family transcriptional regulator [Erysipelotrichaceae bacterium]
MNAQFKKGALELCVLSQLAIKDQYGYELTVSISEQLVVATGTLYLILRRLKEENYVDTYLIESSEGPARKYYKLSPKGQKYQTELKAEWLDFVEKVAVLI